MKQWFQYHWRHFRTFVKRAYKGFHLLPAPVRAWLHEKVYKPYLFELHMKLWPFMRAYKIFVGRKHLPFPCCRREELRTPSYVLDPKGDQNLTANRCGVCGRRHITANINVGKFGMTLME